MIFFNQRVECLSHLVVIVRCFLLLNSFNFYDIRRNLLERQIEKLQSRGVRTTRCPGEQNRKSVKHKNKQKKEKEKEITSPSDTAE